MSASLVKPSPRIVIGPVTISFPNVHVPKPFQGQGEPYYSCTLLVNPKTQAALLRKLQEAAEAAANEMWPNGEWKERRAQRNSDVFWWPIRNGDDKPQQKGYAGNVYITAKSKTRPGVVDQNVQPILNAEAIYPGAIVNASVVFFAYKQPKWGVGVGLNNVQLVGDGVRLGGKPDPADEFEPVNYDAAPTTETWLA